MRLIDADAIDFGVSDDGIAVKAIIDSQPTVKAKPVKHAHWDRWDGTDAWNCSACGNEVLEYDEDPVEYGVIYCDHCGARMEHCQ